MKMKPSWAWCMVVSLFCLLAVLGLACRSRPSAHTAGPVPRTDRAALGNERWVKYWQEVVGVKDNRQLERIRRAEEGETKTYRHLMNATTQIRNQLKVGTSEGTLTTSQRDSLLAEIARLNVEIERRGIESWARTDSLLTPEQRKSRVVQLKLSPELLTHRAGTPADPDTSK
jgi:hypothetical protein